LKEFTEKLGLNNYNLICSSFGGLISIKMYLMNPKNISKLVLVDSLGLQVPISHWKKRFTSALDLINRVKNFHKPQEKVHIVTEDEMRKILEANVFNDPRKIPDFIIQNALKSANTTINLTIKKKIKKNLSSFNNNSIKINEISCPTLIIWGKNDKIVPAKNAVYAHRKIKNSELILYDNCGHLPHVEKAKLFNLHVIKFLSK